MIQSILFQITLFFALLYKIIHTLHLLDHIFSKISLLFLDSVIIILIIIL